MDETIKDYPAFYRKFIMPKFRKRISCVTGLGRLPTHGPYIIAANHIGSFDPPMIVSTVNQHTKQLIYFVTEQFVVNILGLRRAVERMGMIPKREQHRNECLEYAREHLEKGRIVGIFVEGMRNESPALLRGKSGAARLALWSKAPVYPVGFKGPGNWSIKQTTRLWFRGMNPPAEIHFGEPLTFPEFYDKEITYDMLRTITVRIMKALEPLSGKIYPY
ncbi:MAG: hypothetical protein COT25_02985 [Candidatus Kerfeldbacteria bacterium CG08_land_8_20_14_0_20_42_7]|uniref:Phospholipid/glycerol acyltransferase domain-containing protein n=1 Tax=Candidatus Kerfeldbacteria bacterium CG08_land_8_20_14_0_20_42_7 TaxID=2014245 RepID=A0A2H0YSQ1_9BACT|nr:MAG: hypothetical protein COT25_02985 [Candidatus Kerfeldbacteria bacterium CG08_land_8_20_14_0_20_42_7]